MKKVLAILLMLVLVFSLSTVAWADSTYSGGTGTESDPYQIKSADDLKTLASTVNSGTPYAGVYFKVMDNIDLSSGDWTPIGNATTAFQGVFDGNNRTISGMKFGLTVDKQNAFYYSGFFGYVKGATIKNFTLSGVNIKSSHRVGGVVGYINANDGAVTNISGVTVSGTIVSESDYAAGIVLKIDAASEATTNLINISDCVNNAAVTVKNGTKVAGFVGNNNVGVTLTNCTNNGNLSVNNNVDGKEAHAAGIVCYAQGPVVMQSCHNTGTVTSTSVGTGNVGGIISTTQTGGAFTLTGCTNTGAINVTRSASNSGNVGGLVGRANNGHTVIIENCTHDGNITINGEGTTNAGMVIGYIDNYHENTDYKISVSGTTAEGTVSGATNVGGVVGGVQDYYRIDVKSVTLPNSVDLIGNIESDAARTETKKEPVATIDRQDTRTYGGTLSEIVKVAVAGDTIKLLANNSEEAVVLPLGVTLDTNDKELTNPPKAPDGHTIVSTGNTWTVEAPGKPTWPSGGSYVLSGHYVTSPFDGVDKVYVDGKLLDSKNYTTSGGNVTLLQSYLDGLTNGKHNIKIVYGTREATGTFKVSGNKQTVESAKTFDAGIAVYGMMALASAAGVVYVTKKR